MGGVSWAKDDGEAFSFEAGRTSVVGAALARKGRERERERDHKSFRRKWSVAAELKLDRTCCRSVSQRSKLNKH